MIGLNFDIVFRLPDRHVAMPSQKLIHNTAKVGRQVLHHHECHSRVRGQICEELFKRLEPTG